MTDSIKLEIDHIKKQLKEIENSKTPLNQKLSELHDKYYDQFCKEHTVVYQLVRRTETFYSKSKEDIVGIYKDLDSAKKYKTSTDRINCVLVEQLDKHTILRYSKLLDKQYYDYLYFDEPPTLPMSYYDD